MISNAELAACAPRVGPVTMSAIVAYESGRRPYAIADNTTHRSYFLQAYLPAVGLARTLVEAGHDIDVGYTQINVSNFAAYGLDASSALEPCRNLAVGAQILITAYRRAALRYGPGQRALAHALSAYNTGRLDGGAAYARGVWSEGMRLRASRRAR